MSIKNDDIRAAVAAGMINEAQAADIARLAEERQGYREARAEIDEPFELFKGFNEIFIVVGLCVLYAGWAALTGIGTLNSWGDASESGHLNAALLAFGLIQIIGIAFMTQYFTIKRRMIAPSILLSILTGIGAVQVGMSIGGLIGISETPRVALASVVTALVLLIYWYRFRIPFSLMITGLAIFVFAISLAVQGGSDIVSPADLFLLSTNWTLSLITIALGIGVFIVAMRFDMSDPHRVTRRAANGFWLHVLAAPAIVNSIALTLFDSGSFVAQLLLIAFLVAIAAVAIVIDRRSFLISGIGYMIALVFTVLDGGAAFVILLIGLGLVLLGANWEKLRCWMLYALPDFKGKDRLPPWQIDGVE